MSIALIRTTPLFDHARTRRPVRAERRAARNRAPDLRGGARASAPGARGVRRAGARHDRPRLRPDIAARRGAVDAERPLPHHARLHAEKGPARPRHDAAHLHRAGQSRLPERSRHGAQVPRQPRAAAGRGGAVRQLAVCRGPAVRLSELSQPGVDRHRPRPLRHAAVRVRGRVRLRALRRLPARRADVLRLPRRQLHRRQRRSRSATSWPDSCRHCRASVPRIGDWVDHVTTAFPEVRLKSYLEMRGADGGPWRRLCALPALWVGLLYDDARSTRRATSSPTGRSTTTTGCATRCRATGSA